VREGQIFRQALTFDVVDRVQLQVAAPFSRSLKMAEAIVDEGTATELDADMLFVRKHAAELDAVREQDAAVLHVFGGSSKRLTYLRSHRVDNLMVGGA
jgi:hypothetical protein